MTEPALPQLSRGFLEVSVQRQAHVEENHLYQRQQQRQHLFQVVAEGSDEQRKS